MIFGLAANMIYRTHENTNEDSNSTVNLMCVDQDVWHRICEMYPKTAENLKQAALLKREIILHYMERGLNLSAHRRVTGIPASISDSQRNIPCTPPNDEQEKLANDFGKRMLQADNAAAIEAAPLSSPEPCIETDLNQANDEP